MILFFIIPALSFLFFFLPKKYISLFNFLMTLIIAGFTGYIAIEVLLSGQSFIATLPINFWNRNIEIDIDKLSALFIVIINFTMITGAWYAIEYMHMYDDRKKAGHSLHFFSFIWLHLSMLMVCMVHNLFVFLFAWEIMSVASFLLVIFESEKPGVLKAGIDYLIQMHIGAMFLVIASIIVYNTTGIAAWEGLRIYFSGNNNIFLFLIFFIGFGIKAGFMPLHTWLPHAHPAAPSHVSGIMSGVMIKLGIYGILRVLLFVQSDFLTIGIFILVISIISGIAGVGTAIIQHDIKKLLAYHSIENIGIIGMGIGIGLIGVGIENTTLAVLGFAGGMLHVLNHSLFKSLLFYSAGTVYRKTHTREIDKMGGLIKYMPHTAILFLVASIAICGLPPFNGFVSEFFIYNSLTEGMIHATVGLKLLMMFSMLALVAIGGLAIFCFTKAFGISFLGIPRQIYPEQIIEAKWYSLFPQYLIMLVIIVIGVFPGIFGNIFFDLAGSYIHQQNFTTPANIVTNTTSISWFALLFIGITLTVFLLKKFLSRNKIIEHKTTWGCAYTGDASKMQYTASSYAENYSHDMDHLLNQKTSYIPIHDEEIFPDERSFKTQSESLVEEKLFNKIILWLKKVLLKLAFVQTGKTQHYIMYMFVLFIVLIMLTIFNLI